MATPTGFEPVAPRLGIEWSVLVSPQGADFLSTDQTSSLRHPASFFGSFRTAVVFDGLGAFGVEAALRSY